MKIGSFYSTCSVIKKQEFIVRNTLDTFHYKRYTGSKKLNSSYWSLNIPEFFKRR